MALMNVIYKRVFYFFNENGKIYNIKDNYGILFHAILNKKELMMQRKRLISRCVFLISLALAIVAFAGCSSGSSADPVTVEDTPENPVKTPPTTSPSQIIGIYSGTYDGQSADFICTGSDCLISVAGKAYAKGVFTNLQSSSASARVVSFTANLTIIEKVNGDGLLCPVSAGETLSFVFPSAGSTDPIKLTVNGVTTDLSEAATYVVTFDHKNNDYSYVPVKAGTTLNLSDPIYNSIAKGNYSLMEWCLDKACTVSAPNPMTVTANVTLYAKWSMNTLLAPTITLLSDGFSVNISSMPDGTEGLDFYLLNNDGTIKSDYYHRDKNNWISKGMDFKAPIVYPFVVAGKSYRWYVRYYDNQGYTSAVTRPFIVTPTGGFGDLQVLNDGSITVQIADGKAYLNVCPELPKAITSKVDQSFLLCEFMKGTGWESENWEYITNITKSLDEAMIPISLLPMLTSSDSVSMPSGSQFWIQYVCNVVYNGDDSYRAMIKNSAIQTLVYNTGWNLLPVISPDIKYSIERITGGVRLTIISNSTTEDLRLAYYCAEAQDKDCTFFVTVKNCLSSKQDIDGYLACDSGIAYGCDIEPNSQVTMEMHGKMHNPVVYVPIDEGCFEIYDPVVKENH